MLRPVLRGVLRQVIRPVLSERKVCYAYNFDGIDDRGVLANRAINIEGDNTFEFWSPDQLNGVLRGIITQTINPTPSLREFSLQVAADNQLQLIFGGSVNPITLIGFKVATRYGLTLIGTTAQLFEGGLGGTLVRTTTFTRGAAREPTAPTLIGCRGNGAGAYAQFYQGLQYDIKINGTLWEMGDRNQTIQLPTPTGLGAELITQSVLENPAVKGTQWTYLGSGRWQYVGDGSFNDLVFISTGNQPEAGFLDFEVESITGPMRCYTTNASVGTLQSNPVFSTVGRFRHYYTSKSGLGGTGNFFSFFRNGTGVVVSCIIKNISFKSLGACNPMQLFNTTSDRWQQVACRINTEAVQVQGGAFITTSDNKKVEVLK